MAKKIEGLAHIHERTTRALNNILRQEVKFVPLHDLKAHGEPELEGC